MHRRHFSLLAGVLYGITFTVITYLHLHLHIHHSYFLLPAVLYPERPVVDLLTCWFCDFVCCFLLFPFVHSFPMSMFPFSIFHFLRSTLHQIYFHVPTSYLFTYPRRIRHLPSRLEPPTDNDRNPNPSQAAARVCQPSVGILISILRQEQKSTK